MKSTKTEIEKIAKDFLDKNKIAFTALGESQFNNASQAGNELKIDYWSVPYEYKVFDTEMAFVIIDDVTQKIKHIMTKHGYSYINGEKEEVLNAENDDESWDDL
jgi:hypothetical protein